MNRNRALSRVVTWVLLVAMVIGLIPAGWGTVRAVEGDTVTRTEEVGQSTAPVDITDLQDRLSSLPAVAPIAEWYNHSTHKESSSTAMSKSVKGEFFIVNVLSKSGKQYAFAMDPTMPSTYGHLPAIPVTFEGAHTNGLPKSGTKLLGVNEGMVITFGSPANNKWHTLQLHGPYDEMASDYYLRGKIYTGTKTMMSLYPNVAAANANTGDGSYIFALDDRTINGTQRVSFTFQGPKANGGKDYYHYIGLNTADPADPDIKYFLTTNASAQVGASGYIAYSSYFGSNGKPTLEQVSSYLFKRMDNRVDTSKLYSTIRSAAELLTWDSRYELPIYEQFCNKLSDAVALYTDYNGRDVTAEDMAAAKDAIYRMHRELVNLSSILKINKEGSQGTSVSYFGANMYVWDEAAMNAITRAKDTKDSNGKYTKGFYFSATPGDDNKESYPAISRYFSGADYSQVLTASGKKYTQAFQSYGIYSGLASKELSESGSPLADSTKVVEPGLWEPETWTKDGKDIRKVYTDVSVPFLYDRQTGYYTLSSDTNGVFFEGEPESGATLQVADKPTLLNIGNGNDETCEDPDTYQYGKYDTYGYYDAYSTAFQPFAKVTDKVWGGFEAHSPMSLDKKDPIEGYLMDGIPGSSDAMYGEMGSPVYGMGMALEVEFCLPDDGLVNGNPITFDFGGDDDVWVYIDDKLVLDIGGVHGAIRGSIDFSTGTVSVFSEKVGRIVDLAGGYSSRTDIYTFDTDIPQLYNGTYYGNSLSSYSIITGMKDGSDRVQLYQENLYTKQRDGVAASAEQIQSYAGSRETHIMKIFYMDRGRNRTNCYINFNLPQPDTLVVEKDIAPNYGIMTDGVLEQLPDAITPELMENLLEEEFAFVLTENGTPVTHATYHVLRDGIRVDKGQTDGAGIFTMKGRETVMFTGLQFTEDSVYAVTEHGLSTAWGTPAYTGSYEDTNETLHTVNGNSYAVTDVDSYTQETLTLHCTNTYCRYGALEAEPQKVVLDYGKPIDIEVVRNAIITGASELIVRESTLHAVQMSEEDSAYGTAVINPDGVSIRFTPTRMLDRVVKVDCVLLLRFEDGGQRQVTVPVLLMPATVVYYETDFAKNVFSMEAPSAAPGSIYEWSTTGTAQEEKQDYGNADRYLHDLVINKEAVPSNGFFVDFDGTGYDARYSKHRLYNGHDFDQGAYWVYNSNRTAPPKHDYTTGTLELLLSDNQAGYYQRYIQTNVFENAHGQRGVLNFTPGENDYVQARFRMENCDLQSGESAFKFVFEFGCCKEGSLKYDSNTEYVLSAEYEALMDGEFVTICYPLKGSESYTGAAYIDTFRFGIDYVSKVDNTSKIIIDYLYVGPLEDGGSDLGQDLNVNMQQELFFDFDSCNNAKNRYDQPQYNHNPGTQASYRNFDIDGTTAKTGTWWAETPNGSPTFDNKRGVMTIQTNKSKDNTHSAYGPYVTTTAVNGKFPWAVAGNQTYLPWHALNFSPQGETWFYARFKFIDCKHDPVGDASSNKGYPYVQFSIIDKDGNGYHKPLDYKTFRNNEYITIAYDVTSTVNACLKVSSIRSLYLRFVNICNAGTGNGKIEIDYIYVGPKKAPENTHQSIISTIRSPLTKNIYMGFTDTPNDRYRYTSNLYAKKNANQLRDFDRVVNTSYGEEVNWATTEWAIPSVENGSLKLTPTEAQRQKEDGWLEICPTKDMIPTVNYTMTGKDIIQVRVKFNGASAKDGQTPLFGMGFDSNTTTVVWNGPMHKREYHVVPEDALNGKWITFTFDISSYAGELKSIAYFYPCAKGVEFSADGNVMIDYIYIGAKDEFDITRGAEDTALMMHFDNSTFDRKLYSGIIFSGINFDTSNATQKNWKSNGYTVSCDADNSSLRLTPKTTTVQQGYLCPFWDYSVNNVSNHQTTFNYLLTGQDMLQIRFKVVGASSWNGVTAKIYYGDSLNLNDSNIPNLLNSDAHAQWSIPGDAISGEKWITLSYDLSDQTWSGSDDAIVRHLIPTFENLSFQSGGYILIDYIYLGPWVESRPVTESLFFGFDDMQMDRDRYASHGYMDTNYDDPSTLNWCYHPDSVPANPADRFEVTDGNMLIPLLPATDANGWYGIYMGNSFGVRNNSLRYSPKDGDYFQIRLKLKDTRTISVDGKADEEAAVILYFYEGTDQTNLDYTKEAKIYFDPSDAEDSGYITLCAPITFELYTEIPKVTGLALALQYLNTAEGVTRGEACIDYIYVGPGELAPDPVYGYDSSYTDDAALSNGSSWVVEGSGVKIPANPTKYTQAQFSFKGTGFDIISRTGMNQATIRVEVTNNATNEIVKTLTVNNKGELELSQIPVVSVEGLNYGEYTVTLWVNEAVSTGISFLDRGGQFHFDAVRIYDPMGVSTNVPSEILKAYRTDREAYPHIKEIRNILLSSTDYEKLVGTGTGALFVDSKAIPSATIPATDANGETTNETVVVVPEGIKINNHYTLAAETYNKVGPKNEIYLAPGQAIALRLQISTQYAPVSVDVGAKIIEEGKSARLVAGIVTRDTKAEGLMKIDSRRSEEIKSATAQYYDLSIDAECFYEENGKRYCYVVLYNDGAVGSTTNILSVTDIKVCYDRKPEVGLPMDGIKDREILPEKRNLATKSAEPYFDFTVDGQTLEAAALVIRATLETPILAGDTKLMHSLNLASDISVNYAVTKESMLGYDSFYLEVKIPGREDALRIDPVEKGYYYYFTLEGLTAVQMNDTLEATLYMEKNGRIYYSESDIYSIAQYAYTQLGKDTVADELKALCAELLRYGSAAQIFKGYRTNALADSAMTEAQRAYLADLSAVTFGNTNRQLGDLGNPTAKWLGKSLILDSKVTLRYVVDLTACEAMDNITMRIRYEDHAGTEQTAVLTQAEPYGTVEGYYSFDFSGLLAAELRTVLQAAVYAGDTQISNTLEYSVDTYGNNKTGTLDTLCRALMAYSDAAKTFFAK